MNTLEALSLVVSQPEGLQSVTSPTSALPHCYWSGRASAPGRHWQYSTNLSPYTIRESVRTTILLDWSLSGRGVTETSCPSAQLQWKLGLWRRWLSADLTARLALLYGHVKAAGVCGDSCKYSSNAVGRLRTCHLVTGGSHF